MMSKTFETVLGKTRCTVGPHRPHGLAGLLGLFTMVGALCLAPASGVADDEEDLAASRTAGGYCSATAQALFNACGFEVLDDYWTAVAICRNLSDSAKRAQCLDDARTARHEGNEFCETQRDWRGDACAVLGEGRYDPDFTPALFDNDFSHLTRPNPYFPLTIGNRWEYRGGTEINTLEVLDQTKLIAGVRCIVVRDLVKDNGRLKEATDDWYAQAKDGNVWYCGEEVKDFETFQGDRPRRPELVSIDGSFKAGRNGAKPGIIFRASPTAGEAYLEEFSLGNAEDVTVILSATYAFGHDPELDRFVPPPLATRFCAAGDCVVTKNFSLLEPGVVGRKYYARGIGVFLEVNPDTEEVVQLVSCNFDDRCQGLPTP